MVAASEPHSEHRIPLTRERVLHGAIAFADTVGIDGLTMRKVAAELGFEVMSLYNHVANKDDMLAGMVDLAASEIDLPAADADWRVASRSLAMNTNAMMLRHPWVATLWHTQTPGVARLRLMEAQLRVLRKGGFGPEPAYLGYHAITTHIHGYTAEQLTFQGLDDLESMAEEFVAGLDATEFVYLAEHVHQHFDGTERGDEFAFVLDMLLDGLERLRDA